MPSRKVILIAAIVVALVGLGIYSVINRINSARQDLDLIAEDLNTALLGSTDNNPNASNPACVILTREIASAILKAPAEYSILEQGNVCTYSVSGEKDKNFGMVTLMLDKTSTEQASYNFLTAKETAYANNVEKVEGLDADEVFYAVNYKQLNILKGDKWLILSLTSPAYPSEREGLISSAKLLLPRIK